MLQKLKQVASRNLVNIPGWRTNRKIVVFESDDWGSIRMPSREVYKKLLKKGIRVDHSLYDKYDILEKREDLEFLFDLLTRHKSKNGSKPVFTFNTVMGNPAFEKIEEDKFKKFYREDFFSSYKKYNDENNIDLWFDAIEENLIRPQFHAREHLNVSLWLEALQRNHKETRIAFEYGFFGLKTVMPFSKQNNFLAAYWAVDRKDFEEKIEILKNGLEIFRDKFGFTSESFVACNFIYPEKMEKLLSDFGVQYIQSQRGHLSPNIYTGKKLIKRNFTGQVNEFDQRYIVRNCFFEPSLNPDNNSVYSCLKEIQSAFRWKKPAVISSHRVNYVGGMSIENRDTGLYKLNKLLTLILKQWPDVEFLSTDKLGNLIRGKK